LSTDNRYTARGVSATKDEIHKAIQKLDKGLYPTAFCKILPDFAASDPAWCNILHADTAGSKTVLAYLYWRETGDISVWKGIAQDSIVMNLDDMACVGCTSHFMISNTIVRNKHLIPGEVVEAVIEGTIEFTERMAEFQIDIHHAGGETADVGDVVRTADVGFTAFSRMKRDDLIISRIRVGDVAVGLASHGQSSFEDTYNSGIGSNGLTSARHDVLHRKYATQYPETYSEQTDQKYIYSGSKSLIDVLDINGVEMHIGKLLLSPTRTYLPVLHTILRELKGEIRAIIHNTGGGQTKVKRFLANDQMVVKDGLPDCPPLFKLIQQESQTSWEEMYQVFNMGCRLEIYVAPSIAEEIIAMANAYDIDAWIIGRVEKSDAPGISVLSDYGAFSYR
jgi:phosphoribosylformylglycinamidine cyclo-ligase